MFQPFLPFQLGVITKGTVIEVNVSELGLVTTSGKVRPTNADRDCFA